MVEFFFFLAVIVLRSVTLPFGFAWHEKSCIFNVLEIFRKKMTVEKKIKYNGFSILVVAAEIRAQILRFYEKLWPDVLENFLALKSDRN